MAGYKNFRLIIGIVTALVLTFNAVMLPAAALEAGSVNETGSVGYIGDDRSALEPAESEFAEKEENTQNDSVEVEEDTQGDKKENIPQEGESGQEAGAPSENAGDAVSTNQGEVREDIRSAGAEEDTQDDKKENIPQEGESGQEADAPSENAEDSAGTNQEEVREDICPDPDTRVKLWGNWREAAKLPAPTGNRAEDMASAARALLGYSLRGEDSGAFCWNRLLAEFCLDYAEVSEEALPRPEEGQDWAELLESADLFRRDEEAIAAGTLVFLALDGQDGEGRLSVGIVTEIEEGVLTVVMADENGMVDSQSVARNDASFVGYCLVEENSGQEADAPSENAGDAVSTNQEKVREDIRPDPDTRVKLWGNWKEAAKLPAPTGDRAEDMASAARALLGNSLRGEDSGAFCWNRLLAEFCLDYAEVSEEALPRPEEGQDWAELLESADLFRRDEEAIAAGTLVFLALDGQDGEGRLSVGIVTEIEEGVLTVVMADENGTVVSQSVARNDASFVGYCSVSERSQMCKAAMRALEMVDGWALVSSEEELRSALSSPEENINIKLRDRFSVGNAPLEIPEGKNVTMDLNGKTLTNNSSENSGESLFKILTGATLTIEDETQGTEENSVPPVKTTSTGNKYGNTASYENGTLTYYVTESEVTDSDTGKTTETVYRHEVSVPLVPQEVSVGTLDGNGKGKPIFWMSGDAAKLIIKGGKICNSSKSAIYCNSSDSTVQIDGGYICNNSVNEIGGGAAISAEKPTTININGGYIYNNTSHGNGGAITAKIGSTIHITGGCIFENTASFDSPASDGETTYGFGGAIYSEGANVTVSGGYIFSNSARTNANGGGGAIYAQGGSVALNGGYLFDNSAKGGYGGAVYMKDGILTVSDSAVLAGNRSVKEGGIKGTGTLDAGGGAVALFGSKDVTIRGGYITGNESEKTGGGLYCRELSAVTMDGGYVTNNKAQNIVCVGAHTNMDGGGGIRLENNSKLVLNDGYITGNMACSGAGICVTGKSSDALLTMNGGYICANRNQVSCGIAGHQKEGAGISIREAEATVHITRGYINNNSIAQSEDWGGGGIFCTEGAYLYIDKILATNNHARGFGGGLAGCPTGHVFVLGGAAAVFDNRADGTQLAGAESNKHADKDALADTTFMASGYSDFFCALGGQVQKRMLGGGMENWKGSCDGRYVNAEDMSGERLTAYFRMGLTANPTDADKSAAYKAAADGQALYMNGNESYTHGGAIMCDGFMFVGDWSEQENITVGSTMDVTAKKAFGQPQPMNVTYDSGPDGANDQEGSACLFDHDPGTKWCNTNAEQAREEILFHTNEPVKAIQYSLTMANDHESNPGRVPGAWTLYGSNDNASWIAIDKGDAGDKNTLLSAKNGEKVTFSIMHRGEYQYYKLVFDTPGAEGVQFADFELYDLTTSPMGDKQFAFEVYQFPASYTAVTETALSGPGEVNGNSEGYEKLFDGNAGTKWYYKGADSPAAIIFSTDRAVKALRYSLTTANDHTNYAERIPKAWTLYGGDSENGEWTVIAQHTENDNCIQNVGNQQEVTFDIPNPASYQYYKLDFESSVSTEIQFSEFKLYTGEANTQEPTLVSTGHNDAEGNITFSNRLSFDHAGTYFFGVVEKKMEGSITSDRHWYKVAVTVGTKTENITGSSSNRITKNTYYIKSIKVEQFMNTEEHAGTVTEQGLQLIWEKEWDVDGLKYINHPYHLFLSDNKDETGEAGDSSNKSVAFVNVQKEKTVNVTVQKQWASYVDANEYYTYCVTVQLFRKSIGNEAAGWETVGEENVLNRAGAWKHTWYELDKNYIYSVKEKEVYYFDGSGNRKVVSPQSFTTEYSTDGETWQGTFDGAAFRPNDSAGSGIIQIRNTKKYYPMPETGGVGSDPFTVGGLAMVVLAAVMFLMHLRRQKKQP